MKLTKVLLSTLLLGSSLSAGIFLDNQREDEFTKMQHLMDNMFTHPQFINSNFKHFYNYPKVNIQELNDKYIITFEVAGISKEELKLSIKDKLLILEGDKKSSKNEKKDSYIKKEIFVGKFERVISLPDNIADENLTTKYDNGVLKVTIPKKEIKKSSYKVLKIN